MNHEESIQKLTEYHRCEKVRDGIAFIAKPPEPTPQLTALDPVTAAQTQIAEAYFGMAQILRGK